MPRPHSAYGAAPYLATTGQELFDTPLDELPPITRSVRQAFTGTSPVATADVVAALFVAIHDLEQRLTEDD